MNYSYIFGFISFIAFAFQLNSGLLLSCYYVPMALLAFDSIAFIEIDVNIG
jgi:quinol-cytochrome oxidoreductase complex cytochrome b subunit